MNKRPPACVAAAPGFTLVEVTLALGIAVFCLVVIFGLMNVGINTSSASVEQTVATNILAAVASDLRAAPTPSANTSGTITPGAASAVYGLTLPVNGATGGNTTRSLDSTGQLLGGTVPARYQLDVSTISGTSRGATLARITVSWPPGAVVKSGSVEMLVALDRN